MLKQKQQEIKFFKLQTGRPVFVSGQHTGITINPHEAALSWSCIAYALAILHPERFTVFAEEMLKQPDGTIPTRDEFIQSIQEQFSNLPFSSNEVLYTICGDLWQVQSIALELSAPQQKSNIIAIN